MNWSPRAASLNLAGCLARCLFVLWLGLRPLAVSAGVIGMVAVQAGVLDTARQTRTIVLAHRDASVPFSYMVDGKPVGYAMDLCLKIVEAIRQELRLPALDVQYLPVTSASRIGAIVEGKAALECGSTTNNADRRTQVDFTIPHFIASVRLVVRRDAGIERIEDLAGRTVATTQGTTSVAVLERQSSDKALRLKLVQAPDHDKGFSLMAQGQADAFAMDDVLLFGLRAGAAEPARYAVVGKPMTVEPYAIMLPRGDVALKRVVDGEMRRVIQSGEIQQIYRKWFLQPIPPKGIALELAMPYMLRESFKYPSDKVGDLVQ